MRISRFALAAAVAVAVAPPARAQAPADTARPSVPAAAPSDVESIDAIMAALYASISGPAGQERDWNRLRSLFHPNARLIPTSPTPAGGARARVLGVEEYIKAAGPYFLKEGFFEREIGREVDQYGNIAQVFSAYDSRNKLEDAKPFARGINSVQLLKDGNRWWVMNIFWDSERPESPIPAEYLKEGR